MKRIFIIFILAISVFGLRAQDTINPFLMDPITIPCIRDSAFDFHISLDNNTGQDSIRYQGIYHCYRHDFQRLPQPQPTVTGLNIAMSFATSTHKKSIEVRGVLIKIHNNDYNNPEYHFTRPVFSNSMRPCDHYMNFDHPNCMSPKDTVLPVYSLYFEHPVAVSDSAYLGVYVSDTLPWGQLIYGVNCRLIKPCDFYKYDTNSCLTEILFEIYDSNNWFVTTPHSNRWTQCVFPIFTLPDTDEFSCPVVEDFGFGGMMAGSALFGWSNPTEHTLYQLAYGPYDMPLDSLQVVETTGSYYELSGRLLSQDVYYQARLRAKCHHACPVHDTVMWTAWSDTVFFYTGDHMPDTSHHSGQPEGIAEAQGQAAFVLSPNPAHGSVTLTLSHTPAEGTTLTVFDGMGREVLRQPLREQVTRIATSGFAAGVYTLTVSGPQGTASRRLSVE